MEAWPPSTGTVLSCGAFLESPTQPRRVAHTLCQWPFMPTGRSCPHGLLSRPELALPPDGRLGDPLPGPQWLPTGPETAVQGGITPASIRPEQAAAPPCTSVLSCPMGAGDLPKRLNQAWAGRHGGQEPAVSCRDLQGEKDPSKASCRAWPITLHPLVVPGAWGPGSGAGWHRADGPGGRQ